jgi:hypothetical protein
MSGLVRWAQSLKRTFGNSTCFEACGRSASTSWAVKNVPSKKGMAWSKKVAGTLRANLADNDTHKVSATSSKRQQLLWQMTGVCPN